MSLSIYRIDSSVTTKAVFIICATINSVYTCKCSQLEVSLSRLLIYSSCVGCGYGLEYAAFSSD